MGHVFGLAAVLWALGGSAGPPQTETIDVTGAWTVTFTIGERHATGLAILSQDGATVTGMIGPAETDMMPAEGTVSGRTMTLWTRPRRGRTAAFARCDVTIEGDRMIGTVDTDRGQIELVKRKRAAQGPAQSPESLASTRPARTTYSAAEATVSRSEIQTPAVTSADGSPR
jgi:hypothetical protein